MKWLSAGLTFVNITTVCGLLFGMIGAGLGQASAILAIGIGLAAALAAWLMTFDPPSAEADAEPASSPRYRSLFFWVMAFFFVIFAVRAFCWLLYKDGADLHIQSTNNLGDLALHVTYIRDFANGSPLWPLNPIFPLGHLRYPAGVDLFNGILLLAQVSLIHSLVWVGLAGSLATFYAFYRWGKGFAVAGFLFNGGIVGFQFLNDYKFFDYQGDKAIAWKSLPLSMFVTQRGLLYAIPAALILLWHWRERFFRRNDARPGPLPFWVEVALYASMPLFHVHTFLALSVVAASLFIFGNVRTRIHLGTLVIAALIPATFCVWIITDHFRAGSVVQWHPGWLMRHDSGDFYHSFIKFWWINFGLWMPLILGLYGMCFARATSSSRARVKEPAEVPAENSDPLIMNLLRPHQTSEEVAFLIPAAAVFLLGIFWKFAPWEWDNLKIMVWGYFIVLPYLWRGLIGRWQLPFRVATCFALFGSGFVSLFGGLSVNGYNFANRLEVASVGVAVRSLPLQARFAGWPTYNHPVLLQGRNMVLGYGGHLWTQGFDYAQIENQLKAAMLGQGDWRGTIQKLGARYLFWGREEKLNYAASSHPWEGSMTPLASGDWGAIYDLGEPPAAAKP